MRGDSDRTAGHEAAAALLDAMSSIRRTTRRRAGRPAVLAQLTGSQLELVRLVRRRPGVSVAQAAEELRLAPNTVSTLVGQLTGAGLMSRLPDAQDRRIVRLELEPAMREKVSAWRDRRVEAVAAALAALPRQDRRRIEGMAELLQRVADALDAQAAGG
jgi:DNA-binding MarR family transcriptional regulator